MDELATPTTPIPGPNKRVFAALVDVILYLVATVFLLPQLAGVLVFAIYFLIRDIGGRSVGKIATGLLIVDTAGGGPQRSQLLLRNVPMAIPVVPIIEYFIMRRSAEGARWGDQLAKTRVRDPNPGNDGKFLLYSIALLVGYMMLLGVTGTLPDR